MNEIKKQLQEQIQRAVAGASSEIPAPDGFVFYRGFYDSIKELPENVQVVLYDNLASYALNAAEPSFENLDGLELIAAKAVWKAVVPQLDANQRRWYAKVKSLADGAARGGGQPGNSNAKKRDENETKTRRKRDENETKEKEKENVNVKDNVNVNVKDKEKENVNVKDNMCLPGFTGTDAETGSATPKRTRRSFSPPSIEDVVKFFVDNKGTENDAKVYFGNRAGVEWKTRGQRIWDWKADASAWIARGNDFKTRGRTSTPPSVAIPQADPEDYSSTL